MYLQHKESILLFFYLVLLKKDEKRLCIIALKML